MTPLHIDLTAHRVQHELKSKLGGAPPRLKTRAPLAADAEG